VLMPCTYDPNTVFKTPASLDSNILGWEVWGARYRASFDVVSKTFFGARR
jgi:hypothetical protein